jgi:hypothetical protein
MRPREFYIPDAICAECGRSLYLKYLPDLGMHILQHPDDSPDCSREGKKFVPYRVELDEL